MTSMEEGLLVLGVILGIALVLIIMGLYRLAVILLNVHLEAKEEKRERAQAIQDLEDYANRED